MSGPKPKAKSQAEDWPAHMRVDADHLSEADRTSIRTFAISSANEHLKAYRETKNGAHFWRAWLILRASGIGVTEPILKKVDAIARELCKAKGRQEVTQAVEMTPGVAQADAYMERKALVSEVWQLACRSAGKTPSPDSKPSVPDAVMKDVAKRHQLDFKNLKMIWKRWWEETSLTDRNDVFDQIAAAMKPPAR